ncbi:unnamed protein product [Fraxinus pennsylvanica]|uniref:Uncharacterized protein n=1 Tax=Fraxinus pennsylvanica TaxID=56036 RepID=A0AAD1ZKS6_9LAMI|nr:unnamed protein product [Fraxinus pennsylvanica]
MQPRPWNQISQNISACFNNLMICNWLASGSMEEFLAVDAAKNAGQIIRSGFYNYKTKNVEHKGLEMKIDPKIRHCQRLYRVHSIRIRVKLGGQGKGSQWESKGSGMVDKFKDAVGSWLGKSSGMQTAKDSLGQSHGNDLGSANNVDG